MESARECARRGLALSRAIAERALPSDWRPRPADPPTFSTAKLDSESRATQGRKERRTAGRNFQTVAVSRSPGVCGFAVRRAQFCIRRSGRYIAAESEAYFVEPVPSREASRDLRSLETPLFVSRRRDAPIRLLALCRDSHRADVPLLFAAIRGKIARFLRPAIAHGERDLAPGRNNRNQSKSRRGGPSRRIRPSIDLP